MLATVDCWRDLQADFSVTHNVRFKDEGVRLR